MTVLLERLERVRRRIAAAEAEHGRARGSVTLLAVSKTRSAGEVAALLDAGQSRFGESYLQEAVGKLDALAGRAIEWHFIGPLQANKTRPVAERFAWVHSVDRARLARRLNDQRPDHLPPLQVCVQVNISGETSKSGVHPDPAAVGELASTIAELPRLRLRGLMAIPAPADRFQAQRVPYRRLHGLQDALRAGGLPLDTLSIGMSDDLEAAVAEGATLVRVGTALFGPRG